MLYPQDSSKQCWVKETVALSSVPDVWGCIFCYSEGDVLEGKDTAVTLQTHDSKPQGLPYPYGTWSFPNCLEQPDFGWVVCRGIRGFPELLIFLC